MATRIQLRRDTAANWASANPVLAAGEPGVEMDTDRVKVGDGVAVWSSLAYQDGLAPVQSVAGRTGDVTITSADLADFSTAAVAAGNGIYVHLSGAAQEISAPTAFDALTAKSASPTAPLGAEMLTGSWTLTNVTNASGVLTFSANGTASQTVNVTAGQRYQLSWSRSGTGGGNITVSLGSVSQGPLPYWAQQSGYFVAATTGAVSLTLAGDSGYLSTLSSISLKPITSNTTPQQYLSDSGGVRGSLYADALYNSAVGQGALQQNTTGYQNSAVGMAALQQNTTGSYNSAVGLNAGYAPVGNTAYATTTANGQTLIGYQSGQGTAAQANYISTLGYQTLADAAGGVAIGTDHTGAGAHSTAQDAIALGTALHQVKISNNATGAGGAALGANCPATTATAPYTWLKMLSGDGSTVYVPCWK